MGIKGLLPVAAIAGVLAGGIVQGAVVRSGVSLNPVQPKTTVPQTTAAPAPKPLTAKQQAAADKAAKAEAAKEAAVSAAETKLGGAEKTLSDLVTKLTTDFQQSADFVAAQQSVEAAGHAYDEASKTVIADLPKTNPAYKDAVTKLAALKAKEVAVKKGGGTSLGDISQSIYDEGNIMGPMEQSAIEDDATCVADKKKLDGAMGVVTKMMTDFTTSLTANADWVSDKAAVDAAKADVTAAKAK